MALFESIGILRSFLGGLWLRRHLLFNFVIRDLKVRYVGSFMGLLWTAVHPIVLLVSYTFVFSVIFQQRVPVDFPDSFPLFVFCGILPWLYFQDTVQRSCTSVVDNSNLIRKTLFPSEILPMSLAISNLITHSIGLLILLAILAFLGRLGEPITLIPVYFFLLGLLSLGLGWLVSALHVFLRDTSQVVAVVLILWFWFTPIFYQTEAVPALYQPLIRLNPMTYAVEGYRQMLLLSHWPTATSLGRLAGFSVLSFLLGGWAFRSTKREFIDVL